MKVSKIYLLTMAGALGILCAQDAYSMTNILKGTYDCLANEYGYVSPYAGAVFYETDFLKNIYRYGPQEEKLDDKQKKIVVAKDDTTKLVRTLFHENENDLQFIPSQLDYVKCLTAAFIGKLVGNIITGDIKTKKAQDSLAKDWIELGGSENDVRSTLKIIAASCRECDPKNKNAAYPPHMTEYILIGFLYAKFLSDPQAQIQKKSYFVTYLNQINSVKKILKDGSELEDETFLTDFYKPLEYQDFEAEIKDKIGDQAVEQIGYMKQQFERALNALIVRRFYASALPKKVLQSYFGYKGQKGRPDCVESALFDFLVSLILFNSETKEYDLSLLPEGVKLHKDIVSLIKNGIDIEYTKQVMNEENKEEEITIKENIKLTPQTINDTRIRQAWYDFVSGHSDRGIVYNEGKDDKVYEIKTSAANVLRIANLVFGLNEKEFEGLGNKLSKDERTVEFEGPEKSLENDTDACKIKLKINRNVVQATLNLQPGHTTLSVPTRGSSSTMNKYYSRDIGKELFSDVLKEYKTEQLFPLFASVSLLSDGKHKLALSVLNLLYYSLNMSDANVRVVVVCDMITRLNYYKSLLPQIHKLAQGLAFDGQFTKKIAVELLENSITRGVLNVPDDWRKSYIELLTKKPDGGVYIILFKGLKKPYFEGLKYLINTDKVSEERLDAVLDLAAERGYLDTVAYIIGRGKVNSVKLGDALRGASENGHLNVVKYLANHDIDVEDRNKALVDAAQGGHFALIEYFVKNVKLDNKAYGEALEKAAQGGFLEIVKYLIENTKIEDQKYLQRALKGAAEHGHLGVIKYLDNNAKFEGNDYGGVLGSTFSWGRTERRSIDLEIVQYILGNHSVDDKYKNEALLSAARLGDLSSMKYLMDQGADIRAQGINGFTALMLAAEKGHKDVVEFVLNAVNNDKEYVNEQNNLGEGPALNLAVKAFMLDQIGDFACLAVLKLLVEQGGADMEYVQKGLSNTTALIYAANNQYASEIVKFLVEHGANIKAKDENGETALDRATKKGNKEIAEYLKKAEEELKNKEEKKE